MVKSNIIQAKDLAPLLGQRYPSHKSWLTIFMRFIVQFDWHLQQTFSGVVDLDQWSKSTHAVYPCCFLSPSHSSTSLTKSFSLGLTLAPCSLMPHLYLPVLISYENLMITCFDYHWLNKTVWGHFVVSLRTCLQ